MVPAIVNVFKLLTRSWGIGTGDSWWLAWAVNQHHLGSSEPCKKRDCTKGFWVRLTAKQNLGVCIFTKLLKYSWCPSTIKNYWFKILFSKFSINYEKWLLICIFFHILFNVYFTSLPNFSMRRVYKETKMGKFICDFRGNLHFVPWNSTSFTLERNKTSVSIKCHQKSSMYEKIIWK